ncbi:hypothetical protein DSO57_1038319 [Entomophthora muscae]|uniref:Uncharacterized protein n=1 Tax=Entomophthora muscae TaxID=34485 RepID=A0ACC2UJJ4_9FUNG|nr:hypothetical protein DSO57_1038319 [Entomophthora muscae]
MKVSGFLGKLLLLAECSALKVCGSMYMTDLDQIDVSCEKWNGDLSSEYMTAPSHAGKLREITGMLLAGDTLPSGLKGPLKVSELMLRSYDISESSDFSQVVAEKIKVAKLTTEELIIAEPSVFEWKLGSIKTITGFTGARLKHVELSRDVKDRVKFDSVTRLDSLKFHEKLTPTFPDLTHVKDVYARDLKEDLKMDIQNVGKLDITTSDDSDDLSIHLNSLETVEDVITAPDYFQLFSASKLTWGRLNIKYARELILNENLAWKGTSFITSDDFCEKYFSAFTARGLDFKTDNHCTFDCKQPSTPVSLASYASCEEIQTIEINETSADNITLHEATTITGDLIITNYNGTFSAPKLALITGNVIITDSKLFFFSTPHLVEIRGSITIQNSSSVSLPILNQYQGQITIQSSGSFSTPNLMRIKGDIKIQNSSSISAMNLDVIEGNINILDSSSFSAPAINQIQGSLTIQHSSSFKNSMLKKIKGDLTILDSSSFLATSLDEIQGNVTILNSSLSASALKEVVGNISIENSEDFSFSNLKKIQGNLNVTNSNISDRQPFDQLESVIYIGFHQQSKNLEFKSLKAINTLRIHNSSLTSMTGIDVTQLEELTIEDCPQLNKLPLYYLKKINSAYISSVGFKYLSEVFYTRFDVSNSLTIKDFQHSQIYLPLLSADQLTLKDNTNLEALHLEATHLTTPLKIINNPSLYVVGFHDMKITYKIQNSNFKVSAASSVKELQSQGTIDTEKVSIETTGVEEDKDPQPIRDTDSKDTEEVSDEKKEVEEDKDPQPIRDMDSNDNEEVSDKDTEIEEDNTPQPKRDMDPKDTEEVSDEDKKVKEDKDSHPIRDMDPKDTSN